MENKRIWIVSTVRTHPETNFMTTITCLYENLEDARTAMNSFRKRCTYQDDTIPSYSDTDTGKCVKLNPDYVGDGVDTNSQYLPTGGMYQITMESFTFDPYVLQDAEVEYEVECTVTRTNNIVVTVRADNEDDAEQSAKYQLEDGDHDYELDTPDDFEIEIESIRIAQ